MLVWSALVVLGGALVLGLYVYHRADEEIRSRVEAKLAAALPGLRVTIRSARLLERQGFSLQGVAIADDSQDESRHEMLYVDEALVHCEPKLSELLEGRLDIGQVVARGVVVRCRRDRHGQWNLARLTGRPCGCPLPDIHVEGGVIEVLDAARTPASLYTFRDVNVVIASADVESDHLVPHPHPVAIQWTGTATGDHLQRAQFQGWFRPELGAWSCTGNASQLTISPNLQRTLPAPISDKMLALGSLQSRADLAFQVGQVGGEEDVEFQVKSRLSGGRLYDPRLPSPLTDIMAEVAINNRLVHVRRMTARYGATKLEVSLQQHGLQSGAPLELDAKVRGLWLDKELVANLPASLQRQWLRYQPVGRVDGDIQLTFRDGVWKPELNGAFRDVSLQWEKFAYPLEHTAGSVVLRDNVLELDLVGRAHETPVTVRGQITNPGAAWTGSLHLASGGLLPIDDRFIAANPPKPQAIIRDLAPRGNLQFQAAFRKEWPTQPVQKQVQLQVVDCSIRHAKFPYPVEGVHGLLEMRNDEWTFQNLVGKNDQARIHCHGELVRGPHGGQLVLNFNATDLALEDELRAAMTPESQLVWNEVNPQGSLDRATARFLFDNGTRRSQLELTMEELAEPEAERRQRITITPTGFPYRMDDVTGHATYREGQLRLENIRVRHGNTIATTNGIGSVNASGTWRMQFDNLSVDRLQPERDLLDALPARLRQAVVGLGIRGPVGLQGALELSGKPGNHNATTAGWDLGLNIEQATINAGVPLEHVSGRVRLVGYGSSREFRCRGNLEIDSFHHKQIHVTRLQGPFWMDDSRILLGAWSEPQVSAETGNGGVPFTPRRLTARAFGGTVYADALSKLDDEGGFQLQAEMDQGNLAEFVRDVTGQMPKIHGNLQGKLVLAGNNRESHSCEGNGSLRVNNADMYELPFVLSLLKTLRSGSTDRTAFETADVAFRIQGPHTYLDRIHLDGDTLSLRGIGELNQNRELDASFYSMLGREEAYLPAIAPILGGASRRFLVIKVNGPMADPQMTREVLPGLNSSLQQLFADATSK